MLRGAAVDFFVVNLFDCLSGERVFVDLTEHMVTVIFKRIDASPASLARSLGIKARNLQRYKKIARSMPLGVLKGLLKLSGTDASALQGKIHMRIGNSGTPISIGPGLRIDEEFVCVAELIRCDGHLPKNRWQVVFVNKEKMSIFAVEGFFKKF